MNHEKRITATEILIQELKSQIQYLSEEIKKLKREGKSPFIRLSELQEKYFVSPWVVKRMIKKGELRRGIDYCKNGKVYLFSLESLDKVR